MSLQAMTWVMREAPVGKDCAARVILYALADHEDPRGRGAYPSVKTLSELSHLSIRTVQRKLDELEELGVIRRGDQRLVSHIRADRRPVVRDLNMSNGGRGATSAPQHPEGVAPTDAEKAWGAEVAPQKRGDKPDESAEPRDDARGDNMTSRNTSERGDNLTCRDDARGDKNEATGCQKSAYGVTHVTPNPKDKPTNKPRETRAQENSTIQGFQPNDQHRALAKILNLDLDAEFEKFRDSSLASNRVSADWDASFRNWLRRGHELGITRQTAHMPAIPEPRKVEPHRHTVACDHVRNLIEPYENRFSSKNTNGYGTSPLLKAKQALADELNEGMTPSQALKALRLPTDDIEDIA